MVWAASRSGVGTLRISGSGAVDVLGLAGPRSYRGLVLRRRYEPGLPWASPEGADDGGISHGQAGTTVPRAWWPVGAWMLSGAEDDVRPREEHQVEHGHEQACHDDHGGCVPIAARGCDRAVQRGERPYSVGQSERQRVSMTLTGWRSCFKAADRIGERWPRRAQWPTQLFGHARTPGRRAVPEAAEPENRHCYPSCRCMSGSPACYEPLREWPSPEGAHAGGIFRRGGGHDGAARGCAMPCPAHRGRAHHR